MGVEVGRKDGKQVFVQGSVRASGLSRRWAASGERTVPLLIDSPEILTSQTTLSLPAGKHLRNAPSPITLSTRFGSYSWRAREESPGRLVIDESLSLAQQRVSPAQYPAFAAFARTVDEAQSQELLVPP